MRADIFDLNLLRALDALLEERSVSRAAQRLHVTQQAMSGSLRRLREQFQDELLVRVGRGMRLTALGAALADPVRELNMEIVATLETHAVFDPATSRRRFRIVMSDYATLTLLPPLMATLAATAPNIVCDVAPMRHAMLDDLATGKTDFCVLPSDSYLFTNGLDVPEGLKSTPLYTDDFVCVVDANHPDVGDAMSLDQYLSASHNLLSLGGGTRSIIEESWLAERISPRVIATTSSFASLIWMLPGTALVATAQRRLATRFQAFLPIRIVECPVPIRPLNAVLRWHVRNDGDPAHLFMRRAIVTAATAVSET